MGLIFLSVCLSERFAMLRQERERLERKMEIDKGIERERDREAEKQREQGRKKERC